MCALGQVCLLTTQLLPRPLSAQGPACKVPAVPARPHRGLGAGQVEKTPSRGCQPRSESIRHRAASCTPRAHCRDPKRKGTESTPLGTFARKVQLVEWNSVVERPAHRVTLAAAQGPP